MRDSGQGIVPAFRRCGQGVQIGWLHALRQQAVVAAVKHQNRVLFVFADKIIVIVFEFTDNFHLFLLEIEVQGALQVKKKVPDAVFIFLTPPDLDELQDRLVGRGTDSAEVIAQRIEKAKEEIALMREYDYAIVNDQVPLAAERVKRVIEAEHFRVDRVIGHYQEMLPKATQVVR